MARPVIVTQTGPGSTAWQLLNNQITPFAVGFNVISVTGTTGTYSIDLTNESPLQSIPVGPNGGSPTTPTPAAYNPSGFSGLTGSNNLNLTQPAIAWRLTVTGTGATGTSITAEAVQAGIRN